MRISLLLVSKRPQFLPVILGMLGRQTYHNFEIVVVLHGIAASGLDAASQRAIGAADVVTEVPASWTLGACTNAAIRLAQGDLVAKIDDDDLYGRDYLAEAVAEYQKQAVEVIGKWEAYYYFTASRRLVLRNPSHGSMYPKMLLGPSLVVSRRVAELIGFQDVPCSVDWLFINDVLAAGIRCYATSRRHLIIRRFGDAHDHTWQIEDDYIRARALLMRENIADDTPDGLLALIGG